MKNIFTTIIILLIAVSSYPQGKSWTLEECMQYAVENSYNKERQQQQNNIYKQNILEAAGSLLPNISATTAASFNFGRGLDGDTNTYNDINSFDNYYEIYASLILFDGLYRIHRVKVEKMVGLMGKHQLQHTKDMIAYETMEAYFNVVYYKGLVELAKQQLEESTKSLAQVKRMEELGIRGFPDVAEIQAKEAADAYNLTRQKNLLTIGYIILKEKMNYPIDETIEIADFYSENIVVSSQESALDIYKSAISYLPKALMAESSYQAQKFSYKAAKGNLFPVISVTGGYSTRFFRYMDGSTYESFSDQLKNKMGQYIGFTLSIPVFDGFSRTANLKRNKAQLVISQTEKEETLRIIYSEIEQALADMNGQADEYYQAKKQVEAMEVAHEVNNRKYQEGLISALELHTSANRVLKARTEELNALLKFYLKQRLVNYYKGESFI